MLSLFRIIKSWFVNETPETIAEPIIPYGDYICALPDNWIPGDGIMIDINFTMEQIELRNYADCVRNLSMKHSESLIKNTSEGRFV